MLTPVILFVCLFNICSSDGGWTESKIFPNILKQSACIRQQRRGMVVNVRSFLAFKQTRSFFFYFFKGSAIFISNETNTTQQEWSVTSVSPRITLTFVNQTYYIKLLAAVDLDVRCLNIKKIRNLNTIVNLIE